MPEAQQAEKKPILDIVRASMQVNPEDVQRVIEEAWQMNTTPYILALTAVALGSREFTKNALGACHLPEPKKYKLMAQASHNRAKTARVESGPTSSDYILECNWEAHYLQAALETTSSLPQNL
ncbi:MAG TPA: hypothetical protein VGT05_03995 [Patescibacteria group bacterium]|nr:hypothetical protein [Patescibacteria group bacterium]